MDVVLAYAPISALSQKYKQFRKFTDKGLVNLA
jgi:hypothetical protein